MTCVCPSAGYCPVLRTTVYPEDHARCQSDEAWRRNRMKELGIRVPVKTPSVPFGVAEGCGPCEAAAKTAKPPKPQPISDPKPVVSNRRGRAALGLRDQFYGQRVFLFGGGPSLRSVDLSRFQRPGIVTAAMNNVATLFRPNLWFCVDQPRNFAETIWRDPAVMKFTFDKHLKDNRPVETWNGKEWVKTGLLAKDCPNTFGFNHTKGWNAETFLTDDLPTWGVNSAEMDPDGKSKNESVMLPTLWLLYWLGFRVVYLLGCDFHRGDGHYAFDERCAPSNDTLFAWLDRRFSELRPHFRQHGFTVLNCTEGSHLTAFDRISVDHAIEATLETWPETVVTKGQYRA